ncbi:CAMP receptor-like protein [Penicillium waksmanii]|uniref:CAMP receptor-like protein n=1 Tax=Penicillium waksmanii TaxID=69791 RepID=UPI002547FC3C|nr:CAMP receptor-like protein [Penicillium waksmanii]KAJ6000067.1 CAMP receptor-like protein [Penicillium waksmanii]
MAGPSEQQLLAISITERTCSAISITGTFVIVATFIGSRAFRKPINRLVFYASWGNLMANVATLISQDGIHAGLGSHLCQMQAFFIQWFMPADALWTFAMACNVYLTFFHKYDSEQLRQIEWKYILFCYGVPLIPAFVYFFIKTEALGRLWCWVSTQWDWLRIGTFYGPVWLVIMLTFAIYIRAGSTIYQKRRQFRHFGNLDSLDFDSEAKADSPPLVKPKPSGFRPIQGIQGIQGIQVTSEIAYSVPDERPSLTNTNTKPNTNGVYSHLHLHSHSNPRSYSVTSNYSAEYSITIQGGRSLSDPGTSQEERSVSIPSPSVRPSSFQLGPGPRPGPAPLQAGAGAYTSHLERPETLSTRRRSSAAENTSRAAWAYTKYAMLFFIALLVTWFNVVAHSKSKANAEKQVPSTLNRVYSFARPNDFSFGLNYASSFVLPLQGFWNSVIYVSISWPAVKTTWRNFRQRPPAMEMISR